jgi:hypothetical protein
MIFLLDIVVSGFGWRYFSFSLVERITNTHRMHTLSKTIGKGKEAGRTFFAKDMAIPIFFSSRRPEINTKHVVFSPHFFCLRSSHLTNSTNHKKTFVFSLAISYGKGDWNGRTSQLWTFSFFLRKQGKGKGFGPTQHHGQQQPHNSLQTETRHLSGRQLSCFSLRMAWASDSVHDSQTPHSTRQNRQHQIDTTFFCYQQPPQTLKWLRACRSTTLMTDDELMTSFISHDGQFKKISGQGFLYLQVVIPRPKL